MNRSMMLPTQTSYVSGSRPWIKCGNKYYNPDTIHAVSIEESCITIRFFNGDIASFYTIDKQYYDEILPQLKNLVEGNPVGILEVTQPDPNIDINELNHYLGQIRTERTSGKVPNQSNVGKSEEEKFPQYYVHYLAIECGSKNNTDLRWYIERTEFSLCRHYNNIGDCRSFEIRQWCEHQQRYVENGTWVQVPLEEALRIQAGE